jgi:hypothetical protein
MSYSLHLGAIALNKQGFIASSDIPASVLNRWIVVPPDQRNNHPGYNPSSKCYCWGYRPPKFDLMGLGAAEGSILPSFSICTSGCNARACPTCPAPKPAAPCPACPTPTACPTCPVCGGHGMGEDEEGFLSKYGITPGMLIAGVLTAGVGYYGYKKGWFKRLRRRR